MKLLDTSVWVEYFKGSAKGEKVKKILTEENAYTSTITLAEIAKWFAHNKSDSTTAIQQIRTNSTLIPMEESTLIESGKKYVEPRMIKKKIVLIDSITYTTALLHSLELVTSDNDFANLPHAELLS